MLARNTFQFPTCIIVSYPSWYFDGNKLYKQAANLFYTINHPVRPLESLIALSDSVF